MSYAGRTVEGAGLGTPDTQGDGIMATDNKAIWTLISAVDDVTCTLIRLAGLCRALEHVGSAQSEVRMEDLAYALSFITSGLDEQIETLHAIPWPIARSVKA